MNGETALLCPKIINVPTNINKIIVGANHHAFRFIKKLPNSPINDLFFAIFVYFDLISNFFSRNVYSLSIPMSVKVKE